MSKGGTTREEVQTQVRVAEKWLRRTYLDGELLDVTDLDDLPEGRDRDQRLLSRALTAQAVRIVTGLSPEMAAATVIDGFDDQGIDAIAVLDGPLPHLFVVQGKWSDQGKARAEMSAVREMAAGLRSIDRKAIASFNERGRPLAERAWNLMNSSPVPITAVYALMRSDEPGVGFAHAVADEEDDYNQYGEVLDHRVILAREIWQSLVEELRPPSVNIDVGLRPWHAISSPYYPYDSYYGLVTADQVAEWASNGTHLYQSNIRDPLGRTSINNKILETLRSEPENFVYYNNGITILCDSIAPDRLPPKRKRNTETLDLPLLNASVVNGAQTVRTIADAVAEGVLAEDTEVSVRVVVTGGSKELAAKITLASNEQNHVGARDLITLDPVQRAIAEDMRTELDLDYAVRRSELPPSPGSGCSVVEAATALACARADSLFVARIAADPNNLWARGKDSIYDAVFQRQPRAHLLWNAVRVLRRVQLELAQLGPQYTGRGRHVIDHGVYLIVHLTFQKLDADGNDDPELDWFAQAEEQIPDVVSAVVPAVASAIDDLFGENSQIRATCADIERCRAIVEYVKTATSSHSMADRYRRSKPAKKRPPAVKVLIDRSALSDGEILTLTGGSGPERAVMGEWLKENPDRSRAEWVSHRTKPLRWAADGQQYAPSKLIEVMWKLAGWKDHPKAVQGTARWATPSGEKLSDLAWRKLRELDDGAETLI